MACNTVLVRTVPRGVVTVIHPSWPLSDTVKAGVFACKLTLPADSNMRSMACMNLYGHLIFEGKKSAPNGNKCASAGGLTLGQRDEQQHLSSP